MKHISIIFCNWRKNVGSLRGIRFIFILLLILFTLGGCARSISDYTPLLWQVTAPDGQIMYLFGSIHAADEALYPLPAYINDAFEQSDYLAVEVDIITFENNAETITAMSLSLMYQDGKTIADELGLEFFKKAKIILTEQESEIGLDAQLLENFKPYMWYSMLSNITVDKAGLSLDLGLDRHFLELANERSMEILEMESIDETVDMFLGFSPSLWIWLLEEALDVDNATQELKEFYNMWKQGDEQGMAALYTYEDEWEMPKELAEEYINALITQRNLVMTETAIHYMEEGKTVFYVVGLSHMLGENGIVEQFRQNGYVVERIK